jgi:hypothetical protein
VSLSSNAHGKEDDKALTSGVDGQTDRYIDTQMHANKLVQKTVFAGAWIFSQAVHKELAQVEKDVWGHCYEPPV